MDGLYRVGTTVLHGMYDSFKGFVTVFHLDKEANRKLVPSKPSTVRATKESLSQQTPDTKRREESKVLRHVLQCCVLNGGIFWFSIQLFELCVLPGLNFFLSYVFGNASTVTTVWSWMRPSLSLLFNSFWVAPLFLLSKIVNSLWFQDIADSAYKFRKGRPQLIPSISKLIADTLISFLIQVLFLLQSTVVKYLPIPVPFACTALYIVHMSLLCSLYAFEYKWFNMGWELHKRLTYIENNWPFFLGFGLPLAIVCELPNSIVLSGCVFSVLFPFFILSANEATPKVAVCDTPLKLFSLVVAVTNAMFRGRSKPGKAALSTPIAMVGRGDMTPPLTATPTTSLSYQQFGQHHAQTRRHQHQRQHRNSSPSPSAVSSVASSAGTLTSQQQQAVLNRNFRR